LIRTYKFKLEPTAEQMNKIEWTLSMCRWLYNTMLEQRKFAYERRRTTLNFYTQKSELPQLKKEITAYKEIYSQVLQDVPKRLDLAFQSFFRRIKNGEKPGYPRFKGKNRYDSFTYPQSGFCLEGKFLKLSKIGDVRIKCHRQMEGKVKTCQIKRKAGKYYAYFTCETESQVSEMTAKQVGIDLGVKHLAITSDGEFFDHPKYLRKSERKIKYLQRMVSRRKKVLIAERRLFLCSQRHGSRLRTGEGIPRIRSAAI
jgi:putative transposase